MSSEELARRLRSNKLDLALVSEGHGVLGEELWRGPLRWVGPTASLLHRRDPLPLAVARPGCTWRRATLEALGRVGRRTRITYNSTTQSGCFAVALAGLALTVSTPTQLPAGLSWLGETDGLPALPEIGIELALSNRLREAQAVPDAVSALSAAIRQGFVEG
jgi:hypothetical protein